MCFKREQMFNKTRYWTLFLHCLACREYNHLKKKKNLLKETPGRKCKFKYYFTFTEIKDFFFWSYMQLKQILNGEISMPQAELQLHILHASGSV